MPLLHSEVIDFNFLTQPNDRKLRMLLSTPRGRRKLVHFTPWSSVSNLDLDLPIKGISLI